MDVEHLASIVIDRAYLLHREVGPGLLEGVYEAVLERMIQKKGLRVERQKPIPFAFDDLFFPEAARADLLVEGKLVVELKSVSTVSPVHAKQLLTYLRLLDLPLGILINFGAPTLKEGVQRIVNNHGHSAYTGRPRNKAAT